MKRRRRECHKKISKSRAGEAFLCGRCDLGNFVDAQDGFCRTVKREEKSF